MFVKDLIEFLKSGPILSVSPSEKVKRVAEMMDEHKIGYILVSLGDDLVGVLSERDLVYKIMAKDLNSAETEVQQIMTSPVQFVTPETSLFETLNLLKLYKCRHMPVKDQNEKVIGIISERDITHMLLEKVSTGS